MSNTKFDTDWTEEPTTVDLWSSASMESLEALDASDVVVSNGAAWCLNAVEG